jgi:hypothetical protein
MSAGLYTHGVLALDAPRGLFVPSPLVGDLAAVCSIVAWYGVIGLVGRSSEALGLRGPRGLGMAGLGLLTLSVLGGLVDSALRVRRLYWVTHPDRHENPLADQILLAAHEPLQQLLPAVGTLIGWIGLLAILVVLVWLRGRTPQGRIVAAKLHG